MEGIWIILSNVWFNHRGNRLSNYYDKLKNYLNTKKGKTIGLGVLLHLMVSVGTDYISLYSFMNLNLYYVLKLVFAGLLVFLWYIGYELVQKIQEKDPQVLLQLKMFAFYAVAMLILLVLVWPGNWTNDDVYMFHSIKRMDIWFWQSFISNIVYLYSLMLIPFPAGIVIIQVLLISYLLSNISFYLYQKQNMGKRWILYYVPFFSFPVLFNNMFTLRSTLYAYLDLYYIKILYEMYESRYKVERKQIMQLVFVSILLSTWRPEGFYYCIITAIFLIVLFGKYQSKKIIAKSVIGMGISCLILMGIQNIGVKADGSYGATAYVSVAIDYYEKAMRENDETYMQISDRIFNKDIMEKTIREQSMNRVRINGGLLISEIENRDLAEFKKAFYNKLLEDPKVFIDNRIHTYFNTFRIPSDLHDINNPDEIHKDQDHQFHEEGLFTKSPFPNLRYGILTSLYLHFDQDMQNHTWIFKLIWTHIIPTILYVTCILIFFVKKQRVLAFILVSVFLKNFIIFISAPSYYYMYYFPIYLVGNAIFYWGTLYMIQEKRNASKGGVVHG